MGQTLRCLVQPILLFGYKHMLCLQIWLNIVERLLLQCSVYTQTAHASIGCVCVCFMNASAPSAARIPMSMVRTALTAVLNVVSEIEVPPVGMPAIDMWAPQECDKPADSLAWARDTFDKVTTTHAMNVAELCGKLAHRTIWSSGAFAGCQSKEVAQSITSRAAQRFLDARVKETCEALSYYMGVGRQVGR